MKNKAVEKKEDHVSRSGVCNVPCTEIVLVKRVCISTWWIHSLALLARSTAELWALELSLLQDAQELGQAQSGSADRRSRPLTRRSERPDLRQPHQHCWHTPSCLAASATQCLLWHRVERPGRHHSTVPTFKPGCRGTFAALFQYLLAFPTESSAVKSSLLSFLKCSPAEKRGCAIFTLAYIELRPSVHF